MVRHQLVGQVLEWHQLVGHQLERHLLERNVVVRNQLERGKLAVGGRHEARYKTQPDPVIDGIRSEFLRNSTIRGPLRGPRRFCECPPEAEPKGEGDPGERSEPG